MTDTQEGAAARRLVQGMWASVASAWGEHADEVDERAAPITAGMLDSLRLRDGLHVLELASGPGGAGFAAATRVGPTGWVVISDVVEAMVTVAELRARAAGVSNVATRVLDLEAIDEPDGSYDAVLCREGLMFAVDPSRAVREMHRVLRPGGRVAVAVWSKREDNPWLTVVLDAIGDVTGMVLPPPGVPGPFSLGDPVRLAALFDDSGFADIDVDAVAAPLSVPSFDAWWHRNLTVAGPVVAVLNRMDEETRARVRHRAHDAVAPYWRGDALELPGLALVVSGDRP
jgi:SAM-dependent methyltransferase